jgi:hypothetical protein
MIRLQNYKFREGQHRGGIPVNITAYRVNTAIIALIDAD